MELKKGMYVRYTRGVIKDYVPPKIAKIVDCEDEVLIKIDNGNIILRSDIQKASHNLIDLIEAGDYVNDYKVVKIFINIINKNKVLICLQNSENYNYSNDINDYMNDDSIHIYNEDIKSIVTKEQFDSMKYEVCKDV